MPIRGEIFFDYMAVKFEKLQDRWSSNHLMAVFQREAESAITVDQSKVEEITVRVQSDLSPEQDTNALNEDAIRELERERRILCGGIKELNDLWGETRSKQAKQAVMDEAKKANDDDRLDVDRLAARNKTTYSSQSFQLQIYNMDTPFAEPLSLKCDSRTCSHLLYRLIRLAQDSKPRVKLVPELWVRHEKRHNFGGSGLCWEFLQGTNDIDESVTKVDVVNARKRKTYIVAAVHENEKEIPVIIDVPRLGEGPCCKYQCGSLAAHLDRAWKSRRILLAKRISRPEEEVLTRSLNTSVFPTHTNDLYLKCEEVTRRSTGWQ